MLVGHLDKAEANYCITEKEPLAASYFIEYFRQYLLGRRVLVRSDHQSCLAFPTERAAW